MLDVLLMCMKNRLKMSLPSLMNSADVLLMLQQVEETFMHVTSSFSLKHCIKHVHSFFHIQVHKLKPLRETLYKQHWKLVSKLVLNKQAYIYINSTSYIYASTITSDMYYPLNSDALHLKKDVYAFLKVENVHHTCNMWFPQFNVLHVEITHTTCNSCFPVSVMRTKWKQPMVLALYDCP